VTQALTGATPRKTKILDQASQISSGATGAVGTAGVIATTTVGTLSEVILDNFNVLNGWLWVPTPRETIVMNATANAFGLYFPVAPSPTTGWSAGLVFAELG
jgi:hypothetical protein